MTKICILGFGCASNQDNAFIMKGLLKEANFELVSDPENVDIVIIVTCIVKSTTENRMRSLIEKLKHKKLIIAGCMPQAQEKICKDLAPGASLINTCHIKNIVEVVEDLIQEKRCDKLGFQKEIKLNLPKITKEKNIATIQISEGCKGSCSFCIVKFAKGKLVSYPQNMIINEIRTLVNNGYKKILLTAQDTVVYGMDTKEQSQLPSLINEICKIDKQFTLRVGMMNPMYVIEVLDELIEAYKNEKVMKFLHIPIQSGSDKVLQDMNRNIQVNEFIEIVQKFRKHFPDISISTDIIVGYPTETEHDFQKTLKLVKEIKPEVLNISKFGSRPGTLASKLKQLPSEEIKRRSIELTKEFEKIKN